MPQTHKHSYKHTHTEPEKKLIRTNNRQAAYYNIIEYTTHKIKPQYDPHSPISLINVCVSILSGTQKTLKWCVQETNSMSPVCE